MKQNGYKQFFKKAQEARVERQAPSPRPAKVESRPAALKKRRKPARTPWGAVVGLCVTLVLAISYLLEPAAFESIFSRIEISAFGAAEAAGGAAEKSKSPQEPSVKSAEAAVATAKSSANQTEGRVSEDLSHYEKLRQRKDELDAREKELVELEEELQRQKVELDKRIQQLEATRSQIAQTLQDRVEVDQEKVNKLVELYSSMKPKQAADVIGTLNEDLAVEILAKMKKKNAAEVMNLLSPEKSRVLSEKYMGYRKLAAEPKGT